MELKQMDWYHRAAKSFAADAMEAKEADKLRKQLAKSGKDTEKLSDVYFDIQIEEDWISRIERAIPHLEAAIREDRQFIKSEGNVTPIERVRKVSRSSVEHLARHSEMITHVPEEGEDLIPDRLNVYENESNFAVYENRVLYMVLCYTRDFVDYRLRRINQAWKDSCSELSFQKSMKTAGRELSFALCLNDKSLGDDESERTASYRRRIETISGNLSVLLSMPLMKEVALAPMVTPPITRTNILKMDVHFKEVVALYDFLSTYMGDGFTMSKHERESAAFSEEMEREITELVMASLYLSYKYGKNAGDELERRYLEEEEHRREEYLKSRQEKIREMLGTEDWRSLSNEDMAALLDAKTQLYEENIASLQERLKQAETWEAQAVEAQSHEAAMRRRTDELRNEMDAQMRSAAAEKATLLKSESDTRVLLTQVREELAREQEANRFLRARLHGMTEAYVGAGGNPELSEKEDFLELEKEKEAFDRLFERNWKEAKKKMRKRILWGKR